MSKKDDANKKHIMAVKKRIEDERKAADEREEFLKASERERDRRRAINKARNAKLEKLHRTN
jgi:hypothetical protein